MRGGRLPSGGARAAVLGVVMAVACVAWPGGAGAKAGADQPTASASKKMKVLATQSCTVGRQRPTRIVFACADFGRYVHRLRWRSWGGKVARGNGTLR